MADANSTVLSKQHPLNKFALMNDSVKAADDAKNDVIQMKSKVNATDYGEDDGGKNGRFLATRTTEIQKILNKFEGLSQYHKNYLFALFELVECMVDDESYVVDWHSSLITGEWM